MSAQLATVEGILELFRETDRRFEARLRESAAEFDRRMAETDRRMAETDQQMKESSAEFDRRMAETDRQMKETDRVLKRTTEEVGKLGNRMGKVIERMVAGHNIIKQFQDLGYDIDSHSRNKAFGDNLPENMRGEIDLFLENGDLAIIIEVKTTFKAKNIGSLKNTMERFRRASDMKGDKRRFVGAIAGAVIEGEAVKLAHEEGIYVIVQSGKAMEILPTPEGFVAKQWEPAHANRRPTA